MRVWAALLLLAFLVPGCGPKQAPAKDYWDEEARLQMFQGAVQGLQETSKKKGEFAVPSEGAKRSNFTFNMQISIGSAQVFLDHHAKSENAEKIRGMMKELRDIEATNPTGPDQQLTAKLKDLTDRALALKMRPMTKEEENSIQKSIK